MNKIIDDLSTLISLQLEIMVKRKAITESEYELIKANMQDDSLIEDLIPILQIILDKEVQHER